MEVVMDRQPIRLVCHVANRLGVDVLPALLEDSRNGGVRDGIYEQKVLHRGIIAESYRGE